MRLAKALAMTTGEYDLFINGTRRKAQEGRTIERTSPAHGVVVSRYACAGPGDLELAIASGRTAFDNGPWPTMRGADRAAVLLKVADLIDARRELIATLDVLESGKPIAQARGEIAGAADLWRYAAALAR
ncbi:MAG: aldehyde dehydrogenase family protein, partial [Hyphomicrobiales bacterium]